MASPSYAYLAQVEVEIKTLPLDTTRAPVVEALDYLTNIALPEVTARIDTYCQQSFMPYIKTEYIDANRNTIDWYRNQLMLESPLLSADSVSVTDVALTQWDGVLYSEKFNKDYCLYPIGETPAYALQGLQVTPAWYPGYYGAAPVSAGLIAGAVKVTGTWGYNTDYAHAWMSTGDALVAGINDSATTFTVTDADGALPNGSTPRFSPCQLIRIGSEFMAVTAVNTTTNVITVQRGVRGSTAAAHLISAPIELYVPDPNIVRACIRWASYLYQRRTVFEDARVNAQNTYVEVMPQDVPLEVRGILRQYIRPISRRV